MDTNIENELQGTLSQSEVVIEHPAISFDATLTVGARSVGITFDVFGQWERGFPGTREMPAEPKRFDVRRVFANDHDCTSWLNDDSFAEWFFQEIYGR